MTSIIEKAKLVATVAHGATGQRRKQSGIAYINHPADVVNILTYESGMTIGRRMIAAAWLHDVVEDTHITIDFIKQEFDTAVSRMVFGLTNERPEGMNRAERHEHNAKRLAACADDVKIIKLADSIANMRDIIRDDPKFAPQYLKEKRILLDTALLVDCKLWRIADEIVKLRTHPCLRGCEQAKDVGAPPGVECHSRGVCESYLSSRNA